MLLNTNAEYTSLLVLLTVEKMKPADVVPLLIMLPAEYGKLVQYTRIPYVT